MEYISHNLEETKDIAREFSTTLTGGEVIALRGELGAGKTTFVQGLALALGVTDLVRSPTYTIMNVYKTAHKTIKQMVHLDLYRLQEAEDLDDLELEEWLNRKDVVIVAEWFGENQKRTPDIVVAFSYGDSEKERKIQIEIKQIFDI